MTPADFSLFVPTTKLPGYRSYGKVVNAEICRIDVRCTRELYNSRPVVCA